MTAFGGVVGAIALPRPASAQTAGVVALNERVSLLTTGGTNVLALSTPDGLIVVDSGAPELAGQLIGSLKSLSPQGVTTVFNTHWHAENTGANEVLGMSGATIVAHENTRLWMSTPTWMPAQDRYRAPRPRKAQPNKTFRVDGSMTSGGERIDYGYLLEAHTSGDIYVFFRDANVLAVGDVASPARGSVVASTRWTRCSP
jgi:glyoxylase-like metal-dependent hydrolase (beta-lactamase superfamily II)